jgi:hypothetical protein
MAADVFISHSAKDKHAADAACAVLERRGIRCWIAPRDIVPGSNWGASIIEAIEDVRVLVLVVSANANTSSQIEREVERAIHLGRPVIPFRIEDIKPTKALEYFISASHWLDAFTPPVEQHLDRLADVVRNIIDKDRPAAGEGVGPSTQQRTTVEHASASSSPAAKRAFPLALIAASAAILLVAVAGTWFYASRTNNAPPLLTTSSKPPPSAAVGNDKAPPGSDSKPHAELVPEDVPFIRDAEQATLRNDYLNAPDHKALALSFIHAGFASDQKDDETAITAALESCRAASDAVQPGEICQLYAVGNAVLYKAGRPPMPPEPWVQDDPSVSRPFAADQVPIVGDRYRSDMTTYANARPPKALVVSSTGGYAWRWGNASQDEAVRRALEICGARNHFACLAIAVDNAFIVPAPTTMKAIGFFHAASEPLIAPELRQDVLRRLGNATKGWNAVAVGASGMPSLALKAATEQSAIDDALEKCRAIDRECRVIAIGPFRVAALPAAQPNQPAGQ